MGSLRGERTNVKLPAGSGNEIVELYISDMVSGVVRPDKELKNFKKVSLKPGEKKTVEFLIPMDRLSFLNGEMKRVVGSDLFDVLIGRSSEDMRLESIFIVENPIKNPLEKGFDSQINPLEKCFDPQNFSINSERR